MTPEPLQIVIVGEGVAGAMTAAVLSRTLPGMRYSITSVRSADDEPTIGLVEASLSSIRSFHADLDLADDRQVEAGLASFTLGSAYSGWPKHAAGYFMPFGDIGAALNGVAFHQLAQRLIATGRPVRLGDYSVATHLAQAGRFAVPSNDDRSVLSTYSYGLHLDSAAYADALLAQAAGMTRASSPFTAAELAPDGSIAAILLEDGQRLPADFVIDASGAGRGPMAQLPGAQFESWESWLPCDRSVEVPRLTDAPPAPHSLFGAHHCGWRRTVPAIGRRGEYVVYSSQCMSDEQAMAMLGGGGLTQPKFTKLQAGRLKQPWLRNCIAIGPAAALLEPLASTSLHLIQSALGRLTKLFPVDREVSVEAREYNRLTTQELDRTRDFAILRYKLNGRTGEAFWDELRDMAVPGELDHKIDQYSKRGRVPLLDGDIFEESEWALVFSEHGVQPERYDVLADTIPLDQLAAQLDRMRQVMQRAAAGVPLYGEYLARIARLAPA